MPKLIYIPTHKRHITQEDLVAKIATYLFIETSHETSTGNWCTSDEEIAQFFDITISLVQELKDQIVEELETVYSDFVESVETYMDGEMLIFDLNLWHNAIYGFIEDDASFYTPEN